jgi:DNA-binding GntR family transcriptional regulator
VLRMLQEEGLVEIEPNQRTRVTGLDPQELDDVYASRILLETLALSMTFDGFTTIHQRQAKRLLTAMRRAARTGDFGGWFDAHGQFHRLLTEGAGPSLRRQLAVVADRAFRYIRIYQVSEPASWQDAGDREHAAILEALAEQDHRAALSGLANHLARTAKMVLRECAPDYPVKAVPHALDLVERRTG